MFDPNQSQTLLARARIRGIRGLCLLAGLLAVTSPAQTLTVLNSFSAAGNSIGYIPEGSLIMGLNRTLYGTATGGGAGGSGVVFKVQTDGSGFTVLWNLSARSDGGNPEGTLLLSGNTLYGTAFNGGSSNAGTMFALNIDGSGFTNLYSFSGGDDGANPVAGLILAGNMLYGTASAGGSSADGTVFAVNTNGGGFSLLKTFSGANGANPDGALVLSGSELFGTTYAGGTDGLGTIFEISTNGTGFVSRYSFKGGTDCGNPYAGLVLSGFELYGTTTGLSPDIADYGSIFRISTSGSGFTVLKTFLSGDGTGANPYGGLIVSGSELYGTTESGTPGYGTVFKLATAGGSFTTLSSLSSGGIGGYAPNGGLVLSGSTLYGTASSGGTYGYGTLFEINTGGGGFSAMTEFSGPDGASRPYGQLVFSGNTLYGTTEGGGSAGYGTVFQMSPSGTGTTFVSLGFTNGTFPYAGLTLGSDGNFYGTAYADGSNGFGTVFKMTTNGTLATLVSFARTNGANPRSALTLGNDGNFYGTTYGGGKDGDGTVFQMTTNGTLVILVSFAYTNGENPSASLTLGSDGNFYGSTPGGGSNAYGTLFRITTNGALATLASFDKTNGAGPQAALTQGSDGNFYGTTSQGGSDDYGTVFQMTTNGALATLVSFDYTNGAYPQGVLTLARDGNFYGTTSSGGSNGYGTVFQITTNGTLTTLFEFAYTNGAAPQAGLILGGDGNIYGTTSSGGNGGDGTVFRLSVVPAFHAATLAGGALNLTWSTVAGWMYQLRCSTDLSSSNWISLGSPATAIGATLSTTDSVTNGPQRFYRVVVLP